MAYQIKKSKLATQIGKRRLTELRSSLEEFRAYLQSKNAEGTPDDQELMKRAEDEITFLEIRQSVFTL